MLLVICGAGASYDSAPSRQPMGQPASGHSIREQHRPPLANELFGDRGHFGEVMQRYRQCLPIIPALRHPPSKHSVEMELQRLQAEAPAYPERHSQLAAIRYYLQEILLTCGQHWQSETHSVSNYSALVDEIRRWKQPNEKVCFVTFNYDTLLDSALSHAGYPFTEMSGYIGRDLMLIKLHGSVNWGRKVALLLDHIPHGTRAEMANFLINNYANLKIATGYCLLGGVYPPAPIDNCPVVPALAIPVEDKLDFECPHDHVERLAAFIPQVTKILTIGWRGTEKPFLDLLRKGLKGTHPDVMVVSGTRKESEATAKQLQSAVNGRFTCQDGGFSDYMINRRGTEFLSTRITIRIT